MKHAAASAWQALSRIGERVLPMFGAFIIVLVLLLVGSMMLGGAWDAWIWDLALAFLGLLAVLALLMIVVRLVLWRLEKRGD